jgi:hypothetical protein
MGEKSRRRSPQTPKAQVEPGSIDELVRVLALNLRYSGAPQGALVHDMSKAGWGPSRIAELLGTTANTVNQQKRRKRPQWPKQ